MLDFDGAVLADFLSILEVDIALLIDAFLEVVVSRSAHLTSPKLIRDLFRRDDRERKLQGRFLAA